MSYQDGMLFHWTKMVKADGGLKDCLQGTIA
jgi:hypothetical protein